MHGVGDADNIWDDFDKPPAEKAALKVPLDDILSAGLCLPGTSPDGMLHRKDISTTKGKKRTSDVRRRRRSSSEASLAVTPSRRSAADNIDGSPCTELALSFSPAVSSRHQAAARAECPAVSSPIHVRERATVALAQDPRSTARMELSEASRRRNPENICRALIPAVRLHVEVSEIESALRVLNGVLRQSSAQLGEQSAEGWRATHTKLDAMDKRISKLAEDWQMVLGCPSQPSPAQKADVHGAVSSYLAGTSSEVSLDSLSTPDLRQAIQEAQAQADAANAKLRLLQNEALSRLG